MYNSSRSIYPYTVAGRPAVLLVQRLAERGQRGAQRARYTMGLVLQSRLDAKNKDVAEVAADVTNNMDFGMGGVVWAVV